jgi:translation initiation factor IF-1
MAKAELIEYSGVILERLPEARFRIALDNGHESLAYTAGKLKKFRIRLLVGDRVTVEMTPYDLTKCRIIYRHKDENAVLQAQQPRRNFRRR